MSAASNESETVRRHAYHALRVLDIVEETADTRTFVMDIPDPIGALYRYQPGQFCTVRVHLDGADIARCYSMSSAPAVDDRLAVTVKRVPGGVVSNFLHDRVDVGDELEMMPPAGVFCERPGEGPFIAFCGGSGVTPVFSIVKQVLHSGARPVRLFYANRDPDSVIFHDALADLEVAHPDRLTVHQHLDSDSGYVTAADVAAFLAASMPGSVAPSDTHVYICGPTPFMDLVERGVLEAGIPSDNIAIERFVNAVLDERATDAADTTAAVDATTLTITIKRKRHTLDHVVGDTVLDAARRASLNPPYSCEQGNCATCMALVTDGTVTMRANNALTPDEVAEGWILTCQSLPTSPTLAVVYDDL